MQVALVRRAARDHEVEVARARRTGARAPPRACRRSRSPSRRANRRRPGRRCRRRRRCRCARAARAPDRNARSGRAPAGSPRPGPRRTRAPRSQRRSSRSASSASVSPRAMRIWSWTRSMPGERLGDSVLDLQARVHLEEEVAFVRRPGTRRCRRPSSRPSCATRTAASESSASRRAGIPGGGASSMHLLVSALHRAIPAAERDHRAVRSRGDLHLDVAAARDLALDEEASVAERGARLGAAPTRMRRRAPRGASTTRMPRPPPPAVGLHDQRIADARRGSAAWAAFSRPRLPLHGETGTPEAPAICLAAILSPSRRIAAAEGPRKRMPASVTRSTKRGSSATKPQPGHTASAPARRSASRMRVVIEVGRDLAARRGQALDARRRGARRACRDRPRCRARSPELGAARARAAPSPRGCSASRLRRGSRSRAGGSA